MTAQNETNGIVNGAANGTADPIIDSSTGKPFEGTADLIIPLQINGILEETESTFDVINPSTGEAVWKASSASKQDLDRAVGSAQAAFPTWARTKPTIRRDIFNRAADIFESRGEEYAGFQMTETGAGEAFSKGLNIPLSVGILRDIAGRIATICGSVPVCDKEGQSAIVHKEPFGVVLALAPWNAPYILGFRSVAYALAAGNTTILKAPELSPRCYWAIGQAFAEAGLPAGCLNVVSYRPEDAPTLTEALVAHPAIKKVNFTGSTAVGSIIAATCGKYLKPCLMELGGKNNAIVLDDANLELAAKECVIGSFAHSGQVCMSTDRIIVSSTIASQFKTLLTRKLDDIFGPSTPAPILAQKAGVIRNKKFVSDALSSGGKIIYGDPSASESTDTRLRPIVIDGLKEGMDMYAEEAFGPTVGIVEVGSEEEAVTVANDTGYGLSAAVFTEDLRKGFRVAKQIDSGAVHINSMTIHDEPVLPHGGNKRSGFGRFNATSGFEEFLRTKTVTWLD